MNLITAHLTRLTTFSGRENRQPFWLWILTIYIAQMILTTVLMAPLFLSMSRSMTPLMGQDQTYLNEHPEVASQMMLGVMAPMMRNIFLLMAALGVLFVVLIAAAAVRRLHDTNRSGWWALPQAVLQVVTLGGYAVIFPRFFTAIAAVQPGAGSDAANAALAGVMPLFGLLWLINFGGFIYMVVLIVFLATRGTVGPNRYGDDLLPPPIIRSWQQPQWRQPQQWEQPGWQPPQPPAPPPPARIVGPWSDPPQQG